MKENSNINLYDIWRESHATFKSEFSQKQTSFVRNLIPEVALSFDTYEVLQILQMKFGFENISKALDFNQQIDSPVKNHKNGEWIKSANMVGVNIRTIGNFFNLIKYLLTLSDSQDSIHILPIWEPGVVSSLYGKTSWNINPEFFSLELQSAIPSLNTVEKQLKVVTNFIHLMGKTVGLDVIPHTDRFSEMTFLYPSMFEWVLRTNHQLVSVNTQNGQSVEEIIWSFINKKGTANDSLISCAKTIFFDPNNLTLTDSQKLEILFGKVEEPKKRLQRRLEMMQEILCHGFETLPVTMAPPYRGLHLKEGDFVYDQMGNKWYNYQFDKPEGMSRVFGPLTRYKFYNCISDDSQELNFNDPNVPAWNYICKKYFECQQAYNFDFMRGDMAHIQPRPEGIPNEIGDFYDPLKSIKTFVSKKGVPYFSFFAETFLAPPNTMGYGNELDHLEAIEADSTLGDLQGCIVGSNDFMQKIEDYINIREIRNFAPSFTMISADKDDPRFDEFYQKGNHLRFFIGLFLKNMPAYMAMGFECRNSHLTRGKNEEYSKLYVFQISDDKEIDKVTHGAFEWGKNYQLFHEIEKQKLLAETLSSEIFGKNIIWHKKPSLNQFEMVWQYGNYQFVANISSDKRISNSYKGELIYSSKSTYLEHECEVYKVEDNSKNN